LRSGFRTNAKACYRLSALSRWKDAETGDQIEINRRRQQCSPTVLHSSAHAQLTETMRVLRQNRIDRIELRTGDDYLPALRSFFKQRERRMMVR
jgi:hypothetical protein